MRNDWRTDNWAGHYPIERDPRCYHFARHLREFEPMATYNFADGLPEDTEVSTMKMILAVLFVLTVLANMGHIINFLTHVQDYYIMWVNGFNDMVKELR